MPVSISGTVGASSQGLQSLQNVPQEIETLVNTARQALEAVRSAQDGGNPLSALLAGFGTLAQNSANLPSLDAVLGPLRGTLGGLPDRALADITAIRGAVGDALEIFGATKDLVLSGNLDQAMEQGVGRVLDVAASRLRPGDEVGEMFHRVEEFFQLFSTLVNWQQHPPDSNAAAQVLSAILVGAPHDLLARPAEILETALRPLENILPDGPDLTLWRNTATARAAFWARIEGLFTAGGAIDWARLEADLRAESQLLLDIRAAQTRLLSGSLSAIVAIRLDGLAELGPAVSNVPATPDFRLTTILHGLRDQIEDTLNQLQSFNPTADDLRRLARGLGDNLRDYLEQSPLGQLRNLMLDFQHRLLLAIESLPFRGLARQAEEFLRGIAGSIDSLDVNALRQPIHDFFASIESHIQSGATGAVRDSVGALWHNVDQVFEQINTQLTSLRTTLEGLVANLQNLIQQLQPVLAEISSSVDQIKQMLDQFDILDAADAVVEELHTLRDKVASIDFDSLPAPALSALHAGAQFLRQIDVAGAVNPPLSEALEKVDPSAFLTQASASISGAMQQLRVFDPQSLVTQLDRPVDELLGVLRDFGPDRLRSLIEEALRPVEDAIRSLDASQLLAPVQHLFDELTARVDSLLNPDLIFGPLDELFKPVTDLVDALDPNRLLGLIAPHSDSIGEAVGSAAGPPPVMQSAGTALRSVIAPAAEASEELFGFRPGDLLVPLIDLYRKFREVFDPLDNTILEPAARVLNEAFHGRLTALQPLSISIRVDTALEGVMAQFRPAQVADRLGPAVTAYRSAARRLGVAARGSLAGSDAAAAQRVVAMLDGLDPLTLLPDGALVQGIVSASVNVKASLRLDALQAAVPALNKLRTVLPDFLQQPEAGAAALRQFIHDLDPAPLRVQINATFDQIGHRLVALQTPLMAGLDEFMGVIEDFLMPVSPGHVLQLARRLYVAAREQILAFSPATFKDEVTLIFDVVKAKLASFSPAFLADELNGLRDSLIQTLHDMVGELVPDMAPFLELQQRVADLKPSRILQPAVDALKPVSDLIAQLDISTLMQPIIDAIERVRNDLPEVVSRIEGGLDEVLNAIPEGGGSGGSAEVSVG